MNRQQRTVRFVPDKYRPFHEMSDLILKKRPFIRPFIQALTLVVSACSARAQVNVELVRIIVDRRSPDWCHSSTVKAEFAFHNISERTICPLFPVVFDECDILRLKDSVTLISNITSSIKSYWIADHGFNEVQIYPGTTMTLRFVMADLFAGDIFRLNYLFDGSSSFSFNSIEIDQYGHYISLLVPCHPDNPLVVEYDRVVKDSDSTIVDPLNREQRK